jgi:serine/threonine protein kinase/DNA-binding winged helix-turn-helix (wHTH) protein
MRSTLPGRVRFGVFELDLKAGELHHDGRTVQLQEQPFRILRMLAEHDGEIASREEIKKKLWPDDTVVEFDHSINAAIKNLRRALGDSAETPQYIETVARRGYRLMVPVEWMEAVPSDHGAPKLLAPGGLIGKRVSHYRVLEILGGGGMGVIYRAEDLKLGRRVALKFLPEELGDNPKALERFECEARAASALDHPNICSIYEFGEHEGQPFIVMQLLEGQTLRDRLAAGSLRDSGSCPSAKTAFTVQRLLDIAVQISDGLEAAHEKGIIHRDIKPANIFLTNTGVAKILDFGVAKLIEFGENAELAGDQDDQAAPRAALDRTLAALDLTRTGIAMGTAGYMSPEQVRGEKLDARTDLFSFGLVLYEMATGQRPFSGETAALVHDANLKRTPTSIRELNPGLPRKLQAITSRALEEDRNARYQHAAEISSDLKRLKQEAAASHRGWRIAVAGVFAIAAIAGVLWFKQRQPALLPDLKLRQLTHSLTDNAVKSGAISPDGKYLAYTDMKGIHIEYLDTGQTRSIPQPEVLSGRQDGWEIVQWFPDGTSFLANVAPPADLHYSDRHSSVWRFSILGDSPRKLRDDAEATSISPDGALVGFLVTRTKTTGYREIWQMGPNGEQPTKLVEADENSELVGGQWLAGGSRIVYHRIHLPDHSLETRELKGGPPTTVFTVPEATFSSGLVLPDGRIFNVLAEPGSSDYDCNISRMRIDPRTGKVTENSQHLTDWTGFCVGLESVTADGKRMTFLKWAGEGSISIAGLPSNRARITSPRRLTRGEARHRLSAWTADSQAVIFLSKRNGQWGIYKQYLNQDTPESIVPSLPGYSEFPDEKRRVVPRTSPDGSLVLYTTINQSGGSSAPVQLMRVSVTGGPSQVVLTGNLYGHADCARSPATLCAIMEQSQDLRQLVFTAFDPWQGRGTELTRLSIDPSSDYKWALSPDGTLIAVVNRSDGRIHLLFLDGRTPRELTVKGWNSLASVAWTADGNGLFVSSLEPEGSVLMYVDLHGKSRVLWKEPGGLQTWAVPSPDGRYLAIEGWTLNSNIWMMENF